MTNTGEQEKKRSRPAHHRPAEASCTSNLAHPGFPYGLLQAAAGAGRAALPVALALAMALVAGGALAAVFFGTPVDVSGADVQPIAGFIEGIESDMAVAADGTVYVLWEDDQLNPDVKSDLYYNRSSDNGTTWPASGAAAYTSPADLGDPSLAVSGTQVYIAWVEETESTSSMVVQKALTPTSPLTFSVPKTPTNLVVYLPDLEIDSSGRMHVVFWGFVSNLGHVYYSNRLPPGGWLTATTIYTATHGPGAANPRLALGTNNDNLHVVLQELDDTDKHGAIQYVSATNTAGTITWHTPVTITSVVSNVVLPDIAVDSDDVIHVVWSHVMDKFGAYNEGRPFYAYSTSGGTSWTIRTIDGNKVYGVTKTDPNNPWPRIATLPLTGTDEVYVVWEGGRCDAGTCGDAGLPIEAVWLAASANRGSVWSGPRQLSQVGSNNAAVRPVPATYSQTVHVAWSQQVGGGDYRIYYVQSAPGSAGVYLPIVLKND